MQPKTKWPEAWTTILVCLVVCPGLLAIGYAVGRADESVDCKIREEELCLTRLIGEDTEEMMALLSTAQRDFAEIQQLHLAVEEMIMRRACPVGTCCYNAIWTQ